MKLLWIIACLFISESSGVPLLMSVTHRLKLFNESSPYYTPTVFKYNGQRIVGVDYHLARGEVYFSDVSTGQIFRTWLENKAPERDPVVIAEVRTCDGLAVDWVHDNIYWTDTGSHTLEVATLDGLYRKRLLNATDGLVSPRAVVVDPIKGLLFWSDWGDNASVQSAGLDGKKRRTITTDVHWPNGLTLDISHAKLYVIDGYLSTLSSCNYDGSDFKILSTDSSNIQQAFGLTFHANNIYWNSWQNSALYKINIDSLKKEKLMEAKGVIGVSERMMGLKAVHSSLQPKPSIQDPCKSAKCSHHCLVSRDLTPTCICPFGYRLSNDGKTCTEEGYLLVSWRKTIRRLSMYSNNVEHLIDTTTAAISLGYHMEKQIVFWSDVVEHAIYRAPLDQLNNKTKVATAVTCDGLAVDWVHDVLYWTDEDLNTVEVAELDGSKHMILFDKYLDKPRDIALDPFEGLVFWTDWGTTPKIEQSTLDGKDRRVIIDYDHKWPNGITLDIQSKKIYYVDGQIGSIYRASYDGSDRQIVFKATSTNPLHFFSITLLNDELYWTDWESRSLYRSPKYNIKKAEKLFTSLNKELIPNGIEAVHSSLQKTKENPCAKANCQNMCLGTKYQTASCMGEEKRTSSELDDTTHGSLGRIELTKTTFNDHVTISMTNNNTSFKYALVTTECLGRIGCENDDRCKSQPPSNITFDGTNTINITDLLPASHYKITVIPFTDTAFETLKYKVFNITTKLTDPPETPTIESVEKQGKRITIKWSTVDTCFPGFSSYNYKVFKTANENKAVEGQTNETEVTLVDLETEVNYTVQLYTTDIQHHSSVTFVLEEDGIPDCQNQKLLCDDKEDCPDASDEDVRHCAAIENIIVYKKNKSNVYFRVEVSNNTVKQLEKFIGSYTSESNKTEQFEMSAVPCVVWPESYCFNVHSLQANNVYDFKISAFLRNGKVGEKFSISTFTKEEASGPPENLRVIKHNATSLVYQWNHPNQSNGMIRSFMINIEEMETFEENKCCQPYPMISLAVSEDQILYETATTGMTPAASYAISIVAKNIYVGASATVVANTPPPPMEVIRMPPQVEVSSLLPLSWPMRPRDEQGESPQYHNLIRSYILLLLPPKSELLHQSSYKKNDEITELLQSSFGNRFVVIWENKVEDIEAFKTPIKVNILTVRKQYKFAWVQVAQYKDSYSIDYLESDPFIAV